ncbi:MAG: hypothetical protein AAF789_02995, partial [Bacteroidota bacterium]
MLKTTIRLFAGLLLFTAFSATSQTTWDQFLKKAEKQYRKGKYSKVEKITSKLRKKTIAKKFQKDSSLFALTYVMDAKAKQALASYKSRDQSIALANQFLQTFQDSSSYTYITGQLR